MPCMVSYSRRPQSGQITCYLDRTYHVLLTSKWVRSPPLEACAKMALAYGELD
jgi:hypothetical protein